MLSVRNYWILALVEFAILTVLFLVLGQDMARAAGWAAVLTAVFMAVFYAFVRARGSNSVK